MTRPSSDNTKSPTTGKKSGAKKQGAPASPGRRGPRPPSPPPGLDQSRHEAAQRAARQADILRDLAFPGYMAAALRMEKDIQPLGYRCYLAVLRRDAGDVRDPVARMLLEQLAMCHHRLGQLHIDAGHAKSVETIKVLNAACCRLMSEMRRTALALQQYRTPTDVKPRLRVVKAS